MKKIYISLICIMLMVNFMGCSSIEKDENANIETGNVVEDYLSKGVLTIVVPFPAGGAADLETRILAKHLPKELGVDVVVENTPGAGGTIGVTKYLVEKPNTAKLIMLNSGMFAVKPLVQDVAYKQNDFQGIISSDEIKFALYANAKTNIKNLDDLKNYGKTNQIKFGADSASSAMYYAQKTLYNEMGIDSALITHDSAAQGMVNLLGGHIDVTLAGVDQAKDYVENGDFVPLVVFDSEPYTEYEGISVPSTKELGYEVEFKLLIYYGIRGGSDPLIVDRLHEAISNVFNNADYQNEMKDNINPNFKPMGSDGILSYTNDMAEMAKKMFNIE